MRRRCEALIDLNAIRANYALAGKLAPNSKSVAVIKADAYGHGAIAVARALQATADAFGVAIVDEAVALREAGISEPVLVMEGVDNLKALEYAAAENLAIVVHSDRQLQSLLQAELASPIVVWLKVDTGMHRLGLPPERAGEVVELLRESSNCDESIVVCTHLASADVPGSVATATQLQVFEGCVAGLDVMQSISNSAGIFASPESHRDWNRPGYMLYGNSPFSSDVANARELLPAMTLRSEIIALRDVAASGSVGYGGRWTAADDSKIATVAIGYGDGYPRHAADGTPTLVNGHIAPLAGAVSMDMITIDVTAIDDVSVGDTVVLWGEGLSVNEVASKAGTIGYELLTNVSRRVPRNYLNA
jgi:alanine racemase